MQQEMCLKLTFASFVNQHVWHLVQLNLRCHVQHMLIYNFNKSRTSTLSWIQMHTHTYGSIS